MIGNLEKQLEFVEKLLNNDFKTVKNYINLSFEERGKILGLVDYFALNDEKYVVLGNQLVGKDGISFIYDNFIAETLFPENDGKIYSTKVLLSSPNSSYVYCENIKS